MRSLGPILRREYLQRIRSRWFLVSTFLVPVLFLGLGVGPVVYETARENTRRTLAVVDETGVLGSRVAEGLEAAGYTVEEVSPGAETELGERVLSGELGGYLVLGREALTRGRIGYYGMEGPGAFSGMTIRGVVTQAALEVRLTELGRAEDLDALMSGGALDVRLLEESQSMMAGEDPELAGAFVGAFLLYMVIVMYASAVMRATLEEKTGRIVEILISSVRPSDLMLGKILGVGSVGLTQVFVWVLCGVAAFVFGLPALVAARPDLADPDVVLRALPGPGLVALFLAFFLGGYFLYAAVYAAIGGMCSTEEEAQHAQFPVVLLLVLQVMILLPVVENPDSTMAVATSLVPLFTPVIMYARMGAGGVPDWQLALSLVLLLSSVLFMARIAGKIYRVGILMQGKRPTLPELWRWTRQA
jgi:ABC-2 type transport system permease protein